MGLKRKASDLDELPMSPDASFRRSATPSLTSSPGSLAGSDLSPFNYNEHQRSWNLIGGRPYLDSRTRKRIRDGRPSEQTIHQNTLRKLFDGQKIQRQDDEGTGYEMDPSNGFDESTCADDSIGEEAINLTQGPVDRNQRSIESFFGVKGGARSYVMPNPSCVGSRDLTILNCEGCSASLVSKEIEDEASSMMLDMDGTMAMDFQDNWTCTSCAKRVCDICAVRGDHRVCLECAVPGNGMFGSNTVIHDKMWLSGVGWT